MMKIVVMGSGVIGVASAWWLRQAGHDVVVLDQHPGVAQETSRANGGQISVSYAEPWASPHVLPQLARWAMRSDAPMLFRPQVDWRQWWWGMLFLRECLPSRFAPNVRAMVRMAEYSRRTLQEMRSELDLAYHQQTRGILNFYRTSEAFEQAQKVAGVMRDFGVDRRIVSADEVVTLEPALRPASAQIVGGDYTAEDESGDAHLFTVQLAVRAEQAGVSFRMGQRITRLLAESGRITGVEYIGPDGRYGVEQGDAYVAALGAYTPLLVRPLGVNCPIYPIKGYSLTFPVRDGEAVPSMSLTDSEHKTVYSRLGDQLRMAGTAELAGYSRALNQSRRQSMLAQARALFGDAIDTEQAAFWSGLRPSTPSNVPLIGATRIGNLYMNAGHGTLGWTMSVGSGRALADIVSGKTPEPEFPFLGRR